ncbi:MBL fold metallo-hydrolase [Ktedonosporobacter rubrisoli]|uniref:MBL fold metallo-hydrolase n=1 Tax=Ktedonosporobacter rubrisoli TaxID=2509675 RepID=A0A4P6JIN7_KTERU|nr:MBL fold metallo-hydrolase [Ktedonosporobacter rubrisoli]QBD74935.1 MBL fold metallo-hydrolase [Ktedonosporobacter rubrisoli]
MATAVKEQQLTIGDVRITYLSDGYALVHPAPLYPMSTPADWQSYKRLLDASGQLVCSLGAYVIQTAHSTVLVDPGVGPKNNVFPLGAQYGGKLLANLALADIDPASVDIVFYTHIHSDHVGWIGQKTQDGQTMVFPNARQLVRDIEWRRFDDPNVSRARVEEALELLQDHIELVEDSQCIAPGITVMATPGHTPGHSSLVVQAGNERVLILGDVVHSIVQIDHPEWACTLDLDPEMAIQTRERMFRELARSATIAGTSHFADSVFGRLVQRDGKRRWEAL